MPRGFMLTAEAVQKIKADHQSLRQRVRELEAKAGRAQSQVAIENMILVKVTEIITPKTDDVFGSGKAIVQDVDRDNKTVSNQTKRESYGGDLTDREIDIYNESLVPIPVDTVVRCFRDFKSGLWLVESPQTAIGKAPNGISARSEITPGSGQVDIYYIDNGDLVYSEHGLTAYNIADAAVAGGQYVMIKRNTMSNDWFVDMAECE
tara:strand:+ start:2192 stop:2809 length:618 start_codon:yes stop_codon:yes gene_type:complete